MTLENENNNNKNKNFHKNLICIYVKLIVKIARHAENIPLNTCLYKWKIFNLEYDDLFYVKLSFFIKEINQELIIIPWK